MVDVRGYFPEVIKEVREMKAIAETENPALEAIYTAIEGIIDNQFIKTAEESGIARLEKIVKITPKAKDTLDERKFKVLAKYNEDKPYTVGKLNELLETLCGKNGYELLINNAAFNLKVRVELTSKKNVDAVGELLERIVPVNMLFTVELKYNQHKAVALKTHAQLKSLTHNGIREEVMANV